MISNIFKTLIKILLLPITIPLLAITAAIEYATDSDWEFWFMFNRTVINLLPFIGKEINDNR